MPIRYPEILDLPAQRTPVTWEPKDVILYALGIGMADDPLDERERQFIWEERLTPVPTFVTALARPAQTIRSTGVDFSKVVLARLDATFHQPLPNSGMAILVNRVREVQDKGARGALLAIEAVLAHADSEMPMATVSHSMLARADGHFGGPETRPQAKAACATDDSTIVAVQMTTRSNQAALYRLCGDLNPLHIDPAGAQDAGFERPILHGLCTYAIAYRAILQTFCAYDTSRIRSFGVSFSAPLFPGETLEVSVREDGRQLFFHGRVAARNEYVLRDGVAVLN